MAISCGFYNSSNGDRKYDARDFGQLFDGIIRDGIFMSIGTNFMVTANGTDMNVVIGTGHAWFNQTWTNNDAPMILAVPQSEILLNRIDTIVLEINSSLDVRTNVIKLIKGTPASNAVRPDLVNSNLIHQYPLCDIAVKPEVDVINQEDITNRVGTSDTPFVTGVLETINIDSLIAQWEDEWNQYIKKTLVDTTEWIAVEKEGFSDFKNELLNEMTAWKNVTQISFDQWFSNLQYVLSGDVAGNLQTEIEQLEKDSFYRYYELTNSSTIIEKNYEGETQRIIEENDQATLTTTFKTEQTGTRIITTFIVLKEGVWDFRKYVEISIEGNNKIVKESYERLGKQI